MNPPEKLLTADNPALRQRAKAMRQEMSEAGSENYGSTCGAGRLNGYKFRRQQPMGNYVVDFMCVTPKLWDCRSRRQGSTQNKQPHTTTRADGISQQPGLYRTAFLESRDFAADKRRTGGNPACVTGIGKAACTVADG